MNERIQQMIYNLNEKVGVHWTNEDKLKFAELIVKECVEQGKQIQSQTVSNGSEDYNEGRKMGIEVFMNQIKKHFRIEESV